jgi:uncharacterized small protein (DUF1192 family)
MSPSPVEVQVTDHVTKNDNHKTKPSTTSNDEAALNLHIEQNRLEAQRKRQQAQRETANTLQALTLQQQEQVQKLQQYALYDQLREDTAIRSNGASSNSPGNLKFGDDSSAYVSTFNPPPPFNMKALNSGVAHMHTPPVDNERIMTKAALLPVLGAGATNSSPQKQPSHNNEGASVTFASSSTSSSTVQSPKIIDLTNESTEISNEPPKKKSKTTTIEVTVIVTIPGLSHPLVKKMQSTVKSTGSDEDSAE